MSHEKNTSDSSTTKKTNPLFAWQDSKQGLAIIAVLDFFIAYVFISFAINSGNWLDYLIAVIFFGLGIGNAVKFVRRMKRRDDAR